MYFLCLPFILWTALVPSPAGDGGVMLDEAMLPAAWTLEDRITVPEHALARFGQRLGAKVEGVINHILDAGGIRLQVNTVTCETEAGAKKVFERFRKMHGGGKKCALEGREVLEFICTNDLVIQKVRSILGILDDSPVRWKARFLAAPMEQGDYMKWNRLFNLLKNHRADRKNEAIQAQIETCARSFTFSDRIVLRTACCPWGTPEYRFSKEPVRAETTGDVTTYTFADLPEELDLPLLEVTAEIPVKPFSMYMPEMRVDEEALTSMTDRWPADHEKIEAIVKQAIRKGMSQEEKVEALLNWRRANVRFGGGVTGSRYGTLQVIDQGFGHCCDHCDVLVTLLRAAGIPARLVLGWVPSMGAGHYWVEAYIQDKGWLSVDATTSWLGLTGDYIPFAISEDGEISFVYWDLPEIESVSE
jgi:hypothetical protein